MRFKSQQPKTKKNFFRIKFSKKKPHFSEECFDETTLGKDIEIKEEIIDEGYELQNEISFEDVISFHDGILQIHDKIKRKPKQLSASKNKITKNANIKSKKKLQNTVKKTLNSKKKIATIGKSCERKKQAKNKNTSNKVKPSEKRPTKSSKTKTSSTNIRSAKKTRDLSTSQRGNKKVACKASYKQLKCKNMLSTLKNKVTKNGRLNAKQKKLQTTIKKTLNSKKISTVGKPYERANQKYMIVKLKQPISAKEKHKCDRQNKKQPKKNMKKALGKKICKKPLKLSKNTSSVKKKSNFHNSKRSVPVKSSQKSKQTVKKSANQIKKKPVGKKCTYKSDKKGKKVNAAKKYGKIKN